MLKCLTSRQLRLPAFASRVVLAAAVAAAMARVLGASRGMMAARDPAAAAARDAVAAARDLARVQARAWGWAWVSSMVSLSVWVAVVRRRLPPASELAQQLHRWRLRRQSRGLTP